MKALIFLLVLGNLLFYAFTAGFFGQADNPDAGREAHQVSPEKIKLVSRGDAPQVKQPEPPPAPAPEVQAPPPVVPEKICLRWERLAPLEANRLAVAMETKLEGVQLTKKPVPGEGSGWWVHIPPLADKESADKKAAELRQLGITDYFVIQEAGPNRFAISLGVFSSEKGGQDRLTELKGKGVRSARLAVRPGKDSQVTLEASGPAESRADWLALAGKILPKAQAQDCQ